MDVGMSSLGGVSDHNDCDISGCLPLDSLRLEWYASVSNRFFLHVGWL